MMRECLQVIAKHIVAYKQSRHNSCPKCAYIINGTDTKFAIFKCCCSVYHKSCADALDCCGQKSCERKKNNSERVFYTTDESAET